MKSLEEIAKIEIPKKYYASKTPRVFILGGQPGSGKTTVITKIVSKYKKVYVINGDDYRGYHPDYEKFLSENEETASEKTQEFANSVVEYMIDYCIQNNISFVVEGTMRTSGPVCATLKKLQNTSFKIYIYVLSCSYALSNESIKKRFEIQKLLFGHGRITPQHSHDEAFEGILQTIPHIISDFNELIYKYRIFKRRELDVVFKNEYLNTESKYVIENFIQNRQD